MIPFGARLSESFRRKAVALAADAVVIAQRSKQKRASAARDSDQELSPAVVPEPGALPQGRSGSPARSADLEVLT